MIEEKKLEKIVVGPGESKTLVVRRVKPVWWFGAQDVELFRVQSRTQNPMVSCTIGWRQQVVLRLRGRIGSGGDVLEPQGKPGGGSRSKSRSRSGEGETK